MQFTFSIKSVANGYENSYGTVTECIVEVNSLPLQIPYCPNARMPSLGGHVAKSMLTTLREEPEAFLAKNSGGIQIIADSVKVNNGKQTITIQLREPDLLSAFVGHGIVDGGHTYACLNEAKNKEWNLSTAAVKVSILSGVKDSEIPSISEGRNLKKNVKSFSIVNLAGGWDNVKRHLPEDVLKNIAWRENEPGAIKSHFCSVSHLVKLLCCLDNERHSYLKNQHPRHAIASSSPKDMQAIAEKLGYLIGDALWVEKEIYTYINNYYYKRCGVHGIAGIGGGNKAFGIQSDVCLADGTTFPFSANIKVVYPLVAGFRVFLEEDGKWAMPLPQAWERIGSEGVKITIKHLRKTFASRSSCDVVLRNSPILYEEICMMAQRQRFIVPNPKVG